MTGGTVVHTTFAVNYGTEEYTMGFSFTLLSVCLPSSLALCLTSLITIAGMFLVHLCYVCTQLSILCIIGKDRSLI